MQWLTTQRVLQAQRLRETSDYSVDEIAQRCGFRSPVSLRGHFRRQLGSSPSAYGEAYRARRPLGGGILHTSPGPSPAQTMTNGRPRRPSRRSFLCVYSGALAPDGGHREGGRSKVPGVC